MDWFFLSHRLPLAKAAIKAGYKVTLISAGSGYEHILEEHGIQFIEVPFLESSRGLLSEFKMIGRLRKLYKELSPDLIHHVTIRPVLYGSVAARLEKIPAVVHALSGLGYIYINNTVKNRILRRVFNRMFSFGFSHKNMRLILQNVDDADLITSKKLIHSDKITIIKGSGVNTDLYKPSNNYQEPVTIAFIGRMLWDKGVQEFVDAIKIITKEKETDTDFHLFGAPYENNPMSIPEWQLKQWNESGILTYHGNVKNIHEKLHTIDIVCLPSYREGLPKALIEAASAGKPIVTTDVPGCREVVENGINGYLVPVKNSQLLADRLLELIKSPKLRKQFGEKGRQKAVIEFSEELVVEQTMDIYKKLLHSNVG